MSNATPTIVQISFDTREQAQAIFEEVGKRLAQRGLDVSLTIRASQPFYPEDLAALPHLRPTVSRVGVSKSCSVAAQTP